MSMKHEYSPIITYNWISHTNNLENQHQLGTMGSKTLLETRLYTAVHILKYNKDTLIMLFSSVTDIFSTFVVLATIQM